MTDTICIETACAQNFNIFVATSSDPSQLFGFGVLGLGPTTNGSPPALATALKDAGEISEPVATIWLNDIYSNRTDLGYTGAVIFGGSGNSTNYQSSKFNIHDSINTNGTWSLTLDSGMIGNETMSNPGSSVTFDPLSPWLVPLLADWPVF